MISVSSLFDRPCDTCRPIGFAPRLNFFAKASFTIATFGLLKVSDLVKSRPTISCMPTVLKKSGPTMFWLVCVSVSGSAWNPSTDTLVPQLSPDTSGTMLPATWLTPGSRIRASSTCS
jgi:hypothetical protein